MSTKPIAVKIAGQEYRLTVAPDNEAMLREAVAIVDAHMQKIAAGSSIKGVERIAVMAAISVASDMLKLKKLQTEGETLPLFEIRSRIETLQLRVDNALRQHESL